MFTDKQTEQYIAAIDSKGAAKEYSDRHLFIPHGLVVRMVRKASDELRLIGEVEIVTTPSGQDAVMVCEIIDPTIPLKQGIRVWFGGVNSNSRKRSSRFFGLVSDADIPVVLDRFPPWFHVQGLDLRNKVETAMDLLAVRSVEYPSRCARMEQRWITEEESEWLFYKARLKKVIGPHALNRARKHFNSLIKEGRRSSAWTLCLAFGKTLMAGKPLVDNPKRDILNQSWEFVRIVNSTRLTSVEGPL